MVNNLALNGHELDLNALEAFLHGAQERGLVRAAELEELRIEHELDDEALEAVRAALVEADVEIEAEPEAAAEPEQRAAETIVDEEPPEAARTAFAEERPRMRYRLEPLGPRPRRRWFGRRRGEDAQEPEPAGEQQDAAPEVDRGDE